MTDKRSESSLNQIKSKIKVVFLGDQSTGKTSILLRFMHDKFDQGMSATVGIDFMAKNFSVGNLGLRLQLWDTAGQERFRSLIPSYLKDAAITFIVFDVTSNYSMIKTLVASKTFENGFSYVSRIVERSQPHDLSGQREVSIEAAESKAKAEGIKYFEVSAKENTNIQQAIKFAIEQYVKQTQATESMTEGLMQNNQKNTEQPITFLSKSTKTGEITLQSMRNNDKKKQKKNCC